MYIRIMKDLGVTEDINNSISREIDETARVEIKSEFLDNEDGLWGASFRGGLVRWGFETVLVLVPLLEYH